MRKVIFSVILLAAIISTVQAAPFQTLGMLRTPDAYVLPHRAAEFLLVGYYRDVAKPAPIGGDDSAHKGWFPYGMVGVGILDRLELGAFVGDHTEADGLVYFLNAKVKIIEETLRIPQISVGMDNILSPNSIHASQNIAATEDFANHPDRDAYEYFSPYLVASKQAVFVGIPWMFSLGVGTNRFVGQVSRSRIFNGLFTSAEFSPLRDLSIQGEYDGEDFNLGLKYSYRNFGLKIAGAAIEDLAKDNGYEDNLRIGIGLSWLFDKYAEAKRRPELGRYASLTDEENLIVDGETVIESSVVVPPGGGEVVVVPPGGTTIGPDGQVVILPPTGSGEIATAGSGTQLTTPGLVTQGSTGYKELSPEVQALMAELEALKQERQKAQAAMDDLRKWIQELKNPKN